LTTRLVKLLLQLLDTLDGLRPDQYLRQSTPKDGLDEALLKIERKSFAINESISTTA
jgi:hypothetical protein